MGQADPFAPLAFGSRPSMGAYYPDTRFISLDTHADYFVKLLGRRPRGRDRTLMSLAGSVLHHERVHWQIAHSLSWGIQRSELISMTTTLASVFFRSLGPDDLRSALERRSRGEPPIARTANHDLDVRPDWSVTSLTLAEHAWLSGLLTRMIDLGWHELAALRPPEFMLGVTSQYLARGFDPNVVAFEDDEEFRERARTFKRWQRGDDPATIWADRNLTVQSVEECLALISQLSYIDAETRNARGTRRLVDVFRHDIETGVFGEPGHAYAQCFDAAAAAFGTSFDRLDLSLLGLICELALDPPLPFDREGCALGADWPSFHPALRFDRLLAAAARMDRPASKRLAGQDGPALQDVATELLHEAGLQRASAEAIHGWLAGYDEDTTEWPSQELAFEHVQTAIEGRSILERNPGMLFDFERVGTQESPTPFLDIPYVVIDGHTTVQDPDSEPAYRNAGRQIFNAHVARATDHFAFGSGKLRVEGLPTHHDDGFSGFVDRLHEYFSAAWGMDVPPLGLMLRPA